MKMLRNRMGFLGIITYNLYPINCTRAIGLRDFSYTLVGVHPTILWKCFQWECKGINPLPVRPYLGLISWGWHSGVTLDSHDSEEKIIEIPLEDRHQKNWGDLRGGESSQKGYPFCIDVGFGISRNLAPDTIFCMVYVPAFIIPIESMGLAYLPTFGLNLG